MGSFIFARQPRLGTVIPVVAAASVLVSLLVATFGRTSPVNVGASVRLVNDSWVVQQIDPGGVASLAGLRPGDTIVAIDGPPASGLRRTDPGLDLGRAESWSVLREGERLTLQPPTESLPWASKAEPPALFAIALMFWTLGTFVRLKRPNDEIADRFFRLSVTMALAVGLSQAAEDDRVFAKVIEVVAFALLPSLFLGFFAWFASDARPDRRIARLVHALALAGVILGIGYLGTGWVGSNWYDVIRLCLLALLTGSFVGGLFLLFTAHRNPLSPIVRQQFRIVLLGTALALLPLTVLVLIPETLALPPVMRPQFAAFGLILFPLSFVYAILRYRLLEIDLVIHRTLVYGILTAVLAGCYLAFIAGLSVTGRGQVDFDDPIGSVIFLAFVSLTFMPVRDCVRRFVDTLIYRDRYDGAEMLHRVGRQLTSIHPIDRALCNVIETVAAAMNLSGAAVFVYNAGGKPVSRAALGIVPSTVPEICPTVGGEWIPLVAHEEACGLLYLGPKRSSAELTVRDRHFAETLAGEVAIALANAILIERLRAKVAELGLLRDRLLQVQEAERKGLANELHDGPLQTVLEIARQAASVAEAIDLNRAIPVHTGDRIESISERAQDAAHELRAVCMGLYPSELAHLGLPAALQSLARQISRDQDVKVEFRCWGLSDENRLPEPVEDTLYRVVREALVNVCRHASATRARVDLAAERGGIELTVIDNGRGFCLPHSMSALIRNGHLGLVTTCERVERLGGRVAIESTPGAGTAIRVTLAAGAWGTPDGDSVLEETA